MNPLEDAGAVDLDQVLRGYQAVSFVHRAYGGYGVDSFLFHAVLLYRVVFYQYRVPGGYRFVRYVY